MSYMSLSVEETPRYESAPATSPYRVSSNRFFLPITAGRLQLGPSHLSRADELRGVLSEPARLIDGYEPAGSLTERMYANHLVPLLHLAGFNGTVQSGNGTNEVVSLTKSGTISGGTFTLTFSSEVTPNIAWNATADQVEVALESLSAIGPGNVSVTGGPINDAPFIVTFEGELAASNVGTVTAQVGSLTGSTPGITVAVDTAGATGSVTTPDGNGVPTGAYLWTFTKASGSTARAAEFVAAYTEHDTYLKGSGFGVSQLSLNAEGEMSADLTGLVVKRIANPGYTATYDTATVRPLRRGDLELTWATGSAFSQDFSMQIANPIERGRHLGISSYFPVVLENTGEPVTITGNISKRTIDPDDYDRLVSAGTFSAAAEWRGESKVSTSGAKYSVWVDMPAVQLTGGDPEQLSNRRRFPASFDWLATYDESAGYDVEFTVQCAVTAMETYA